MSKREDKGFLTFNDLRFRSLTMHQDQHAVRAEMQFLNKYGASVIQWNPNRDVYEVAVLYNNKISYGTKTLSDGVYFDCDQEDVSLILLKIQQLGVNA